MKNEEDENDGKEGKVSHFKSQSSSSLLPPPIQITSSTSTSPLDDKKEETLEEGLLFRDFGKRLKLQLFKLGDAITNLTSPNKQHEKEKKYHSLFKMNEFDRAVVSAFQLPFHKASPNSIPIILSLLSVSIVDSNDDHVHFYSTTTFTIKLSYGANKKRIEWLINRRIYDIVRLHTILIFKSFGITDKREIPDFPRQLSSHLMDMTLLSRSMSKEERSKIKHELTIERRNALELYLKELLCMMNMNRRHIKEIYEFFEISYLTLKNPDNTGTKRREGNVRLRSSKIKHITDEIGIFACCNKLFSSSEEGRGGVRGKSRGEIGWRRKSFQTVWLSLRDCCIMWVDHLEDKTPKDIVLLDRKNFNFTIEHSNLIQRKTTIKITTINRIIEIRPESEKDAKSWINELKDIENQLFHPISDVISNVRIEWLVDASSYFSKVYDAMDCATEEIYIHGWWVSPEVYLKRPSDHYPHTRLDKLLQRKARQGIQIYIIIFKEYPISLPINSAHTKFTLRNQHPNIRIQRHPDHAVGAMFWAIHDKMVVIDQKIAFLGGIDLCYGRYDNPNHNLIDDTFGMIASNNNNSNHPPSSIGGDSKSAKANMTFIWNGLDYSNPLIKDFRNVHDYSAQLVDRNFIPRMGWHDIQCVVYDRMAKLIARHFIERWNFICQLKKKIQIPLLIPKANLFSLSFPSISSPNSSLNLCRSQLFKSVCEWSTGVPLDTGVHEAYLNLIAKANHFIYIENQFFISRTCDRQPSVVRNRISEALIDRIVRAHQSGHSFRVYILIPLLPAFESSVEKGQASSVRMIMQYQFATISRGSYSIMGILQEKGIKPESYITFLSLRKWGRLKNGQYVTEQVYVHSKVMIVDDRWAIIGSANINDRSMLGARDSELAIIVENEDLQEGSFDNIPCQYSPTVRNLRLELMKEHLGILDNENDSSIDREEREVLLDPVSFKCYNDLVRHRASLNTQLYRELFRCLPDDLVDSWEEYKRQLNLERPTNDSAFGEERIKDGLGRIKGTLVLFQMHFLKKEDLSASMMTLEYLLPVEVYT